MHTYIHRVLICRISDWYYEAGGTLCIDHGKKHGPEFDFELLITVETPGGTIRSIDFSLLLTIEKGIFLKYTKKNLINFSGLKYTSLYYITLFPMLNVFENHLHM